MNTSSAPGADGAPPQTPAAARPKPGDLLAGKYRLERVIGQGGMGIVYAAVHELLGQRVAVKLLLGANNADASARFLNEARAAARIQHENIARVMDVGTLANGMPYMVLELLEGGDLEGILKREGKLAVGTAVDYVLQALEAVAQAHAVGIIHRDLKPANMFLARKVDGSSHIKVLDFGISKSDDSMLSAAKTSAQAILGSPYYMSPEQLKSSRSVDRRADIWSVGVILYELLTGTYPFDGESVGELFAAILEAAPASPVTRRPDCPPGLAAVILKCLTRDPALRYDGAPALAEALAPFATPRGVASVERIRPAARGGAPTPAPSAAPPGPAPAKAQTAASWQTSQSQTRAPGPSARAYAWVIGIALVLGVGVGAGAFFLRGAPAHNPAAAATDGGPAGAPTAAASTLPSAAAIAPVAGPQATPVVEANAEPVALPGASVPTAAPVVRPAASVAAGGSRSKPTTTAHPRAAPAPDPSKGSRNP